MRPTTWTLTALASLWCFGAASALAQEPDRAAQNPVVRYDDHKVVRAQIRNQRDLRVLEQISPDRWSHGAGIGPVDYRIPPDVMPVLEASGVPYEILIDDVQVLIDQQQNGNQQDGWYGTYQNLASIEARMQSLADAYPSLGQTFVVGNSLEGRPIRGITISGEGGTNGKPDYVIHGGIHAREWVTTMAMPYMIETLLTSYGSDPDITELVDRVNFHIVPVMNVDGFLYTQTDRLWRKNRRNNGNGTWGVDLNRNYSRGWGGEGSSGNTNSETYRGPSPFSEPESQVMRDWQLSLPNFAAFIDVHSYSQLILQPFGYTDDLPPDHDTFEQIGASMEAAMEALYGEEYVHGPTYTTIYPASGVTLDWAYQDAGALGLSFELRDLGQFGFLLPPEQIIPASEECFAGAMELAKFLTTRLVFAFPTRLPAFVDPDSPTAVQIEITGVNGGVYETGSGKLWHRIGNNGAFTETSLTELGNDLYEADLPAAQCGEVIQFYFEASSTDNVTQFAPAGAPADVFSADVTFVEVVIADDFETNMGWTVVNENLDDGPWQRGVPVNGDRGDPPADFDGSGSCYVTDNVPGNSDVDGGPTHLYSPIFDLSDGDAIVTYAAWMYNDDNDGDRLTTAISNNGGNTWTNVEALGNTGGWSLRDFRVSDYVAPTGTMQVRFSVADQPNDSVTEAGIDAFNVARKTCNNTDMVLAVGPLTAGESGQFDVSQAVPNANTYLAYSVRGTGSTYVAQLNVTLDLRSPVQAGPARRADGNGDVSWTLPIPNGAAGRRVWFQAAQFENASNVVETVVQ